MSPIGAAPSCKDPIEAAGLKRVTKNISSESAPRCCALSGSPADAGFAAAGVRASLRQSGAGVPDQVVAFLAGGLRKLLPTLRIVEDCRNDPPRRDKKAHE
jgi:hypothetical protein